MTGHTFAARAAAAVVATVAGAASYSHIADVAVREGEREWVGYVLPLAIDGLIVVGVAALLEDKHTNRVPRFSARVAVLVGVVATLAANIASAEPTWGARLVAVAAPVCFLVAIEVLTRSGRLRSTVTSDSPRESTQSLEPDPADPGTPPTPAPRRPKAPRRAGKASTADKVARVLSRSPELSKAQVAAKLDVSERTVQRAWPATVSPNGSEPQQE